MSFSSTCSLSKGKGGSLGRTNSLISWREKNKGLLEDVYKTLCMLSGKDVAVEAPENQPKAAKTATLEESGEVWALGFESPSRGPFEGESLFDLSYQKFISFSKFMVLPVNENEKEIMSLLRKSESREQHKASVVKRRAPSTFHLVRGLPNLECSVNYCSSNKKEKNRSSGSWFVSDLIGSVFRAVFGGCSFLVLACPARKSGGVSSCSHPNLVLSGFLFF